MHKINVGLSHFLLPIVIIVLVIVIGTSGFIIIEGFPFIDALYMTIITISTIGYMEVHPLSTAGKVFDIILIISSLVTTAFALTQITRYVVDGEVNKYF